MIIWMDGPDHYGVNTSLMSQGPYAQAGGTQAGLLANAGPGGIGHIFGMGINGFVRKVLPGERNLVGIGIRTYAYTLPVANGQWPLYRWRDITNTIMATLWVISTGALELRTGADANHDNETLIWRSDPLITATSWQHVEARVATGAFAIGIDSVTVYEADGVAGLAGFADCAQISIEKGGGTDFAYAWRDLYIWDDQGALNNSGMQGDRQVITIFPTSDGADTDWVPSTGATGWPLISNNPPDDTEFVTANTPDDISSFGMEDIDTDITSISAAMIVARMKKSDAGIATVEMGVLSSGDAAVGAEKAVSTSFAYYSSMFETDPHTDVKWTPAGINAVQTTITRIE